MITLVSGASGAGISTWAACEALRGERELLVSAPMDPPSVRARRVGRLATPASGGFGQVLAGLTGIPAAALDDVVAAGFADVVALAELPGSDGPAVADLGAWPSVASAISDIERFATHCAAVTPMMDSVGGDASGFLKVMELARLLAELRVWLTDPSRVRVTYVTTPDPRGVESATQAMSAARLLGVCVERIVVNRRLMDLDPESVWGRRRTTQQDSSLEEFGNLAAVVGCGMVTVPEMSSSPVTVESLRELADATRVVVQPNLGLNEAPARGALRVPPGCSAAPVDGGYELSIPVGDRAGGVDASRRGDTVLVRCGGVQRQLLLSGALARCEIVHGRRCGGWLVLTMVPDPRFWPRGKDDESR